MERVTSHRGSGEQDTSLRLVGWLFSMFGALQLSGSGLLIAFGVYVLLPVWTGAAPSETWPIAARPAALFGLPGGTGQGLWLLWSLALFVSGLQSVAIGALIRLAIRLEENTRVSARCLEQLNARTVPADPMFRS